MALHCHVGIQYIEENGDLCEDLVAIDPTHAEDRKFLHRLLDEYLINLTRTFKEAKEKGLEKVDDWGKPDEQYFRVYGYMDDH